jgi:RNA methyltransferase, TrmH family
MKINSITSESNNLLKTVRALHRRQAREKEQLFLLEGPHCLGEALAHELELKSVLASQSYLRGHLDELATLNLSQISVVDDRIFEGLATTATSCGVLAVAEMPRCSPREVGSWQPQVIAVADAIQDPGNLGTLVRTAYAAELGGLILLKGSVDPFNPKVVRAAAGALFSLPIVADLTVGEAVEILRSDGFRIVACRASAQKRYFEADLAGGVAIVLGNEGQGLSPEMEAAADECISIPMRPDSESLNVAISGGIILFETLKQRLTVANR